MPRRKYLRGIFYITKTTRSVAWFKKSYAGVFIILTN